MEELLNQFRVENALFIHLANLRPQGLVSELANVVAKEEFVFRQRQQRLWRCDRFSSGGHGRILFEDEETQNCNTSQRVSCGRYLT